MGQIPPPPPRRPARLSESGEDLDYLMAVSPRTAATASRWRELAARLDPNYRAYAKLRKDPSYRPVKAYTFEEAVRLKLVEPPGPSTLDLAMGAAPTQLEYDAHKTPPSVPELGPGGDAPERFEEI